MKCPDCSGKLKPWKTDGTVVGICCEKCPEHWLSERVETIYMDLINDTLNRFDRIVGHMDFTDDAIRIKNIDKES